MWIWPVFNHNFEWEIFDFNIQLIICNKQNRLNIAARVHMATPINKQVCQIGSAVIQTACICVYFLANRTLLIYCQPLTKAVDITIKAKLSICHLKPIQLFRVNLSIESTTTTAEEEEEKQKKNKIMAGLESMIVEEKQPPTKSVDREKVNIHSDYNCNRWFVICVCVPLDLSAIVARLLFHRASSFTGRIYPRQCAIEWIANLYMAGCHTEGADRIGARR